MELERFQKWDGRGVFLLRLDYGFAPADFSAAWRRDPSADLDHQGWMEGARELTLAPLGSPALLAGADRLLDHARRRAAATLWQELARIGAERGLLLWARFPRAAAGIASALEVRGLLSGRDSQEPIGNLPPLYQRVADSPDLLRLHLALEWETGLARARATTVLVEAAARMAEVGELSPSTLAADLGTTTGAARSYLRWMAEAGLARRTAAGYALRHPGLRALFERATVPSPAPPGEAAALPLTQPGTSQPPERPSRPAEPEPVEVPPPEALGTMTRGPRWLPDEMD